MPDAALLRLRDLPPATGDAGLAALLLLDLAEALATPPRHAALSIGALADDASLRDICAGRAVSTDGEAFGFSVRIDHGAAADALTFAAAELALSRYLGRSPWTAQAAPSTRRPGSRGSALQRPGAPAGPSAPRTSAAARRPAYFGDLPAPFRAPFVLALSPRPLFRPGPRALADALTQAFTSLGPDAETDARTRLLRAATLARAFVPSTPLIPATAERPRAADIVGAAAGSTSLPNRRGRFAISQYRRVALIATTVAIAGGIAGGTYAAVASTSASGGLPPSPVRTSTSVQPVVDSTTSRASMTPSATPTTPAAASTANAESAPPRSPARSTTSTPATTAAPTPTVPASSPTPTATPSPSSAASSVASSPAPRPSRSGRLPSVITSITGQEGNTPSG